jgi:hypothetical protein
VEEQVHKVDDADRPEKLAASPESDEVSQIEAEMRALLSRLDALRLNIAAAHLSLAIEKLSER